MINQATIQELKKIAGQMVEQGKGILAADESFGTIEKRFNKINLPSTEENRCAYREMLFAASGIGEYISGVIMFDETIRQSTKNGLKFPSILEKAGMLPGIKVDQGLQEMKESQNEKITTGLDGLIGRLKEYAALGAKFAKWRAVISIGERLPTESNIRRNAKDMAAYAIACQETGLVPMVEPEVLMDGSHTIEMCEEVSGRVLRAVFDELQKCGVAFEGMILKTNMVIPAKDSGQKTLPRQIAEATTRLFKKVLPSNLSGVVFLSGGQSEIEATENLNAMHLIGDVPWQLSFSYGRALQDSALKTWSGKAENTTAAQRVLVHRAKMNGLATLGKYSPDIEKNSTA
ncbi:MAG: class I fructose-bisphosphate aldolase [Patescibacteria group bacterium]